MRTVAIVTSLFLAVSLALPVVAAPNSQQGPANPTAARQKKKALSIKPTWDQCFAMSIERGFNHELEEWQQSIRDCLDGKIPLH